MTDEQAEFTAYFRARRDVVRRTAYLLCGDWHFAEDLTQLAFLRLASAWRKVRDHGALDAYVHTILIRTYVAENRRWFRRRERLTGDFGTVEAGAAGAAGAAGPSGGGGGWGGADDVDERMAMAEALRRLPARQRPTSRRPARMTAPTSTPGPSGAAGSRWVPGPPARPSSGSRWSGRCSSR